MSVSEGRQHLDKTLRGSVLADELSVEKIVLKHFLKSSTLDSGNQVKELSEFWCGKVWTFLEVLRSAGENTDKLQLHLSDDNTGSDQDWKLKVETDSMRVMYRPGPVGSPFHTLCLDGIIDGGITNALAVGWEVPFYKEWWPQFTVPTFKITESRWVRRIRVGEDLSILRFKVPWPLAAREVLMTAFELEYFDEDIVIVLLHSAPPAKEVNEKLHGFSPQDFPVLPHNVVRIDIAGGFVMQKMTNDRFFFRTVIDVDMKLDMVPPWIINFVSRQLAGHGYKLYQKAVLAIRSGGESGKLFQQIIDTAPIYRRVKLALDSDSDVDASALSVRPADWIPVFKETSIAKTLQGSILRLGSAENNRVVPYPMKGDDNVGLFLDPNYFSELENIKIPRFSKEEAQVSSGCDASDVRCQEQAVSSPDLPLEQREERAYEDPEVEWALQVLTKMISYTRSCSAQASSSDVTEIKPEACRFVAPELDSQASSPQVPQQCDSSLFCTVDQSDIKEVSELAISTSVMHRKEENYRSKFHKAVRYIDTSSQCSGCEFLSTSEIETVLSGEETDTITVVSGSSLVKLQGADMKYKHKKSRWHCFRRAFTRKYWRHSKHSNGDGDSGRLSAAQLRCVLQRPLSSAVSRGYLTYKEPGQHHRHNSSEQKGHTLGELLLAEEH